MVDGGHLGWIDGLTLLAVGQRADSDIGIHVRHGGTLRLGPNMRIRDFPVGLKAEEGAIVHSESAPAVGDGIRPFGLRVEGATQLGVFADSGAVVDARHLCSRGHGKCVTGCERELSCSEPSSESGHGVRAERGATLLLELADVSCHTGHGVLVSDAKLSGRELLVHSNGCDGLHVVGDAVATNPRTRAEANGRDGVHVEQGGLARLDQLNSLRNKRSGIYSDFATIVAEYSVLVFDNQGYAVAADRGGVVLLRQANVDNGSSSPAPLDVCAGTRVFMDVEFVEYQGLPWDQPLTNIVPDRDEPTLHSFVLARDLADVRPFPPGTTECWSRTP